MEKQNTINHCSTQQDMAIGFCVSSCCAFEQKWITLITSNCSILFVCVRLQSTIYKVPLQATSLDVFMLHPGDYIHV